MNQQQRRKLYEQGFNDGVDSSQEFMIKALYGAAALAARREFSFDQDQCYKLLMAMDNILTNYFTSEEIIDETWKECNLKVVFRDPIEPFQKIEEENT